jgi:hypothetical protein
VSAQRFADKLQRLLSRRDRARSALLGDELEQPADLRPRRHAQLVAAQERLGRLRLARRANGIGVLLGAEERERLERPWLSRPAETMDLAR